MTVYGREGDILDVVIVAFEPIANTRVAFSGRGWLHGVSILETTGTGPAIVKFVDGLDVNGKSMDRIEVAASAQYRANPGQPGMPFNHGLFINMIAGSVDLYLTIGRWIKAR